MPGFSYMNLYNLTSSALVLNSLYFMFLAFCLSPLCLLWLPSVTPQQHLVAIASVTVATAAAALLPLPLCF